MCRYDYVHISLQRHLFGCRITRRTFCRLMRSVQIQKIARHAHIISCPTRSLMQPLLNQYWHFVRESLSCVKTCTHCSTIPVSTCFHLPGITWHAHPSPYERYYSWEYVWRAGVNGSIFDLVPGENLLQASEPGVCSAGARESGKTQTPATSTPPIQFLTTLGVCLERGSVWCETAPSLVIPVTRHLRGQRCRWPHVRRSKDDRRRNPQGREWHACFDR